jgi:hypothetical protein
MRATQLTSVPLKKNALDHAFSNFPHVTWAARGCGP